MEVEYDAGNLDEAEALADRALAIDPRDVRAAIYRAEIALRRAAEDPALYAEAQDRFADAAAIDNTHPEVLMGYYRSYALEGGMPPEQAAIALEQAFAAAPYDNSVRTTLAHLLMMEDRDPEALVVMGPMINNPHSGFGQRMRRLFESDDPADRQRLMERLQPRPYGYEPPEEEEGEG
jgi:tetratricopeptide (TPR) repeat protein